MGGKPLSHLRRIFQKNLSLFSATRGGEVGGGPCGQFPPPVWRNWSGTQRDKSGTTHIYFTSRYKKGRQK